MALIVSERENLPENRANGTLLSQPAKSCETYRRRSRMRFWARHTERENWIRQSTVILMFRKAVVKL